MSTTFSWVKKSTIFFSVACQIGNLSRSFHYYVLTGGLATGPKFFTKLLLALWAQALICTFLQYHISPSSLLVSFWVPQMMDSAPADSCMSVTFNALWDLSASAIGTNSLTLNEPKRQQWLPLYIKCPPSLPQPPTHSKAYNNPSKVSSVMGSLSSLRHAPLLGHPSKNFHTTKYLHGSGKSAKLLQWDRTPSGQR